MALLLIVTFWAFQCALAGLGVFVSVRPQPPERHRLLAVLFILLAVGGAVVNIAIQRRSDAQLAKIEMAVSGIESNSKQPPTIEVHVPPQTPAQIVMAPQTAGRRRDSGGFLQLKGAVQFVAPFLIQAGQPIMMNINFENKGTEPIYETFAYAKAEIVRAVIDSVGASNALDKASHARFSGEAKQLYRTSIANGDKPSQQIGVGNSIWQTLYLEPLTPEQVDDVLKVNGRLYVFAWATWRNAQDDLDVCQYLQPPEGSPVKTERLVWHIC